tara:strand:+ start:6229 stop:6546 length:318 start_codon:yes stop_codon:yes gene_type:complete
MEGGIIMEKEIRSIELSGHGITEIRIIRGKLEDGLGHLVRIYAYGPSKDVRNPSHDNRHKLAWTLFGEDDLVVPINVSSDSLVNVTLGEKEYGCLGNDCVVNEDE